MEFIMTSLQKKPFGITLASKIAAKAIYDNLAPTSVILGNLILLQKSSDFPKDLDSSFFVVSKRALLPDEKKLITQLLPDLKKPLNDLAIFLESKLIDGWVKKIPPKEPVKNVLKKPISKKPFLKKDTSVKQEPVVVVKKNKLS
jgi:hypothetical protein